MKRDTSEVIAEMRNRVGALPYPAPAISNATLAGWIHRLEAASDAGRDAVAIIEETSDRLGGYYTHANVRLRVFNGYIPTVGDEFHTRPAVADEVLRFYADPKNYESRETCDGNGYCPSEIDKDGGKKARTALASQQAVKP